MTDLAQREKFEEWLWTQEWARDYHFHRRDMVGSTRFGEYVAAGVEFAWQAFQAGATSGVTEGGDAQR